MIYQLLLQLVLRMFADVLFFSNGNTAPHLFCEMNGGHFENVICVYMNVWLWPILFRINPLNYIICMTHKLTCRCNHQNHTICTVQYDIPHLVRNSRHFEKWPWFLRCSSLQKVSTHKMFRRVPKTCWYM